MTDTSTNPLAHLISRRSPVELGLVLTLIAATVAATATYMRVLSELGSLRAMVADSWTATHQHVWIEMANRRDADEPLPTVQETRAVVDSLHSARRPQEPAMDPNATPSPLPINADRFTGPELGTVAAAGLAAPAAHVWPPGPRENRRKRRKSGGRKARIQQIYRRRRG